MNKFYVNSMNIPMKTPVIYAIAALSFVGLMVTGCSDENMLIYEEEKAGIYFYKDVTGNELAIRGYEFIDSLSYTFVLLPEEVTRDTVYLTIRIMGQAVSRDRVINLSVDDSSTAVLGEHFDLPDPIVMPADSFQLDLPVYLNRTPDLKDESKRIYFTLMESDDFTTGFDANLRHFIDITDQLIKPDEWDTSFMGVLYGDYSRAKHRFMIDALGTTEFGESLGAIQAYALILRRELALYLAAGGEPIIDENTGDPISFP